jgi:hypothetical protein
MQILISTLISVPLGAISSLLAWWLLTYYKQIEISILPQISKINENNTFVYRIQFVNMSHRDILGCNVHVKLKIKGVRRRNYWETIEVPIDDAFYPIVAPEKSKSSKHRIRPLVRLELDQLRDTPFRVFEVDILEKIKAGTIELEDLMNQSNGSAKIEICIFGTDSVTRSRVYVTKTFVKSDIQYGVFKNGELKPVAPVKAIQC